MTKKIPIGFALAITLLAMTATLSVTMLLAMNIFNDTVQSVTEREATFSKLSEVDSLVRNNYLGEIDEDRLSDMISTGYLSGINDDSARYFNPTQYSEYLSEQSGQIVGIGATVANDATGYLRVTRVVLDSPAAEVAMDEGSIIKTIGGTDTRGISLDVANRLLSGELGSEVEIVWQPVGSTEDTTSNLLRRSYISPTIEYSKQSGDTGYVKVITFSDALASELDFAINSLTKDGATGLIIDLRGVSQSNMNTVARVANIFVDAGEIATINYNDNTSEPIYISNEPRVTVPLTVIVDTATSGAPELLAVTLREFVGAKIVGENTAGKSSVSEIFQLSDGSAIELTVGQTIPEKGESFDEIGVPLDFEVVLTNEEKLYSYNLTFTDDPQYLKAVEMLNTLKTEAGIEITQDDVLGLPDDLISDNSNDSQTVQDSNEETSNSEVTDDSTSATNADTSEVENSNDTNSDVADDNSDSEEAEEE